MIPSHLVYRISILASVTCAAIALAGPGGATEPLDDENPSRAHLITEREAAVIGETFLLGVAFDLAPHWHAYWDGLNDSGFAPAIDLTLPPEWEAGTKRWPAPKRFFLPEGRILDHGYEGQVTLIIPVRVPETAEPGTATIKASIEWLVCKDVCIPAFAEVETEVPVRPADAATPGLTSDAERFDLARQRYPKPWDEPGIKRSLSWSGNTLAVRVPGAAEVMLYPRRDCLELAHKYEDTKTAGDTLRLRLGTPTDERSRVRGIVEAKTRDGRTIGLFELDHEPPTAKGRARGSSGAPAQP